jgi:HrpA-like RNA helicase
MPVVYLIDREKALIRTRCVGPVTLPEVADHFRQLERDPDRPARVDVLLDLREVSSLPTDDQLRAVGREIQRIRDSVRFGACAIVASSDVLFGTAKMFEVVAAPGFRVTRVFRGPTEAEAWLAEQRSPGV